MSRLGILYHPPAQFQAEFSEFSYTILRRRVNMNHSVRVIDIRFPQSTVLRPLA
jgi:hypothetical protein